METLILFIIAVLVAFGIGFFGARLSQWLENKKIKNNADKFLRGKRENKVELEDGKMVDVNVFRLRNEDGTEYIINIKKGEIRTEKVFEKEDHSPTTKGGEVPSPSGAPKKKKKRKKKVKKK